MAISTSPRQRKGYDFLFKMILAGDSGVGKTSLVYRFMNDSFGPLVSTIGVDFRIKTIEMDGKRLKLQIWDIAAGERFHRITASYYRGTMGVFVVYDITAMPSFESMERWLGDIKKYASEDVQVILIGNKCDMENTRAVNISKGKASARKHGIDFFEASAKIGTNVEEAFIVMTRKIFEKLHIHSLTSPTPTDAISLEKPERGQSTNRSSNCFN